MYSQYDTIVEYGQRRIWKFEPNQTHGSLDDEVYHLNVPMVVSILSFTLILTLNDLTFCKTCFDVYTNLMPS